MGEMMSVEKKVKEAILTKLDSNKGSPSEATIRLAMDYLKMKRYKE